MTDLTFNPTAAAQPAPPAKTAAAPAAAGWGGDGFGFNDFLDLINPLQHLPGVSTIYRAVTGDRIADEARFIGHIVYGGPVGLIAATAETMATDADGRGMSEDLAAWWRGDEGETAVATGAAKPGAETAIETSAETAQQAMAPAAGAAGAPAAPAAGLQQVNGSLLDAFIERQNVPPAPAGRAPSALASAHATPNAPLAPPPPVGAADGAKLAQWMMHALDRYHQQAAQR